MRAIKHRQAAPWTRPVCVIECNLIRRRWLAAHFIAHVAVPRSKPAILHRLC